MTAKVILIATILTGAGILHSQHLPPSARHALDQRFSTWHFHPNHIPNPCDVLGRARPSFNPLSQCNLNADGIPDYVVAITTGRDSNLVEYFVALVSNGKGFEPNLSDSTGIYQGAGELRLTVIPAGDTMAIFGDEQDISDYGKFASDGGITFPTDAVEIYAECEGRWKKNEALGFVFIKGRFRMFSAAD